VSTLAETLPSAPTRNPRLVIAALVTPVFLALVVLGSSTYYFRNQMLDTQATLASTQDTLASTQTDLATAQDKLATTQANLDSTQANLDQTSATLSQRQSDLISTQADRDAKAGQINDLNTSVSQLTGERDNLKGQLDKANASLASAQKNLSNANADKDKANNYSFEMGQAAVLMAKLVQAYDDYDKVVEQQLSDALAANNAAARGDWYNQNFYITRYNSNRANQTQKALAVGQAATEIESFLDSHPDFANHSSNTGL
jgi:chromosome segregation ATPase